MAANPASSGAAPAADKPGRVQNLMAGLRQRFAAGNSEDVVPSGAADAGGQKGASRTRLLLAGLVLLSAAALIVNRSGPSTSTTAATPPVVDKPAAGKATDGSENGPTEQRAKPANADHGARKGAGSAGTSRHSALSSPAAGDRIGLADTGIATMAPDSERAATRISTGSIASLGQATTAASARATPAAPAAALPEELGTPALRQAALSGNGKAAFLVGMHYLKGQGVPRDPKAALTWFQRAANKGVVVAMYRLGTMYEQGQGAAQDFQQAKAWYERAALRGNVRAMHNLGVLLASGKTGAADFAKAAYWFRKAAEHGVRDSQFNLAVLYHRGQGVPRDLAEAWFWYAVAARQGDAAAAEQERRLKPFVGKQRLAAMRQRLQSFHPRPPIRNANVVVIDRPEWRAEGTDMKAATSTAAPRSSHKPLTGRKLVAEVQRLLKKMGYDIGAVDGILGNRTANAIRLFQLQSRLPVNGQPSMQVLERLRAATQGA